MHDRRREAIAQLSRDASQRSGAVRALERCLAFLVNQHGKQEDEASQSLSEDFYDSWIFFEQSFDQHMPNLSDVTMKTIQQWMSDDPDACLLFGTRWTIPPAGGRAGGRPILGFSESAANL